MEEEEEEEEEFKQSSHKHQTLQSQLPTNSRLLTRSMKLR
jgi:hypothetical protein